MMLMLLSPTRLLVTVLLLLFMVVGRVSAFHLPGISTFSTKNEQIQYSLAAPIAVSAMIFSLLPLPSMAAEGNIASGKEIFTSTCGGCHAGGQNFAKPNKTLQKEAIEKYVGSLDEDKVEDYFRKQFVHKVIVKDKDLQDQQITDAITYVVDQATNEKW